MIGNKVKKAGKYLMLLVFLVLAVSVFIRLALGYRSFEGKIEAVRTESYRVSDRFGFLLPPFTEVPYQVERMNIRTKKGEIIDLGIYGSDLDEKSVGRSIRGSYRPGNLLEIKGENVIFGFIDFPGPKIELKGKPNGVITKFGIIK